MIHPIKSIVVRQQGWAMKNFEKTKYGKRIKGLKDLYSEKTCFVVGNGPSLCAEDLQRIYKKKIPCFGSNRVFKIFDKTDWRPDFLLVKMW